MFKKLVRMALGASAVGVMPVATAQIDFFTDFEGTNGITKDGWFVAANYFSADCSSYNSTPYAFAAGDNEAQVANLTTSPTTSSQVMNFFSNYGDGSQANICLQMAIEKSHLITLEDVGGYLFKFDAEVNPSNGGGDNTAAFVTTNYNHVEGSPFAVTPTGTKSLAVFITPALVGQTIRWGFTNNSYNYQDTSIFYDNVSFAIDPDTEYSGPSGPELAELAACEDTSSIRFDGAFGNGADVTCLTDTYEVTTPAEGFEGFADGNRDESLYPFFFPEGGQITFDCASNSATETQRVRFKFERAPFPDNNPEFYTDWVECPATATSEGITRLSEVRVADTAGAQSVDIPARGFGESYDSFILFLETAGGPSVTLTNVQVTSNYSGDYGPNGPTPRNTTGAEPIPVLPLGGLLGLISLLGFIGYRRSK